jgi:hypothetical protein
MVTKKKAAAPRMLTAPAAQSPNAWHRDSIPVAEVARDIARANAATADEFEQQVRWLHAMQTIEHDPVLRVIDEHSGRIVAGTAMQPKEPDRYSMTRDEADQFMQRHGFAESDEIGGAETLKGEHMEGEESTAVFVPYISEAEANDWLARNRWTPREAACLICGHAPSVDAEACTLEMVPAMLDADAPTDWTPRSVIRWAVHHHLLLHRVLFLDAKSAGLVRDGSHYSKTCLRGGVPCGAVVLTPRRTEIDSAISSLPASNFVVHTEGHGGCGWTKVEGWLEHERGTKARQDQGEFLPLEVADILAEAHGLSAREIFRRMEVDHAKGEMLLRDFATLARAVNPRASWDGVFMYPADVDAMCERWGVKYRFPPEGESDLVAPLGTAKALSRAEANRQKVLAAIIACNFECLRMPRRKGPRSEAKSCARKRAKLSKDVFDHAWQGLLDDKLIAYAGDPRTSSKRG